MVCTLKADKCMSKWGKYVQGLVHLGQRVCKMEIWEIKLGELFGAVLGKGLFYWVKEHSSVPARVLERGQWWDSMAAVVTPPRHITKSNMLLPGRQFQ